MAEPSAELLAPPLRQNPSRGATANQLTAREEGELSSSDNDVRPLSFQKPSSSAAVLEYPGGSASQLTGSDGIEPKSAQVEPESARVEQESARVEQESVRVAPVSKDIQPVKGGNAGQPNQHKSEKNRVPFVITFSDGESGSDSEEHGHGKATETRGKMIAVDGSRRPSTPLLAKSHILHRATRNDTKVMPRNVSLSRTSVSSVKKFNGTWRGPLPSEQRYSVKNFISVNKSKGGREHGSNKNVHLNSSKLQDLRQLIAIRENEIKIKAARKDEKSASGSSRNCYGTNVDSDSTKVARETSADLLQFEPKEPDRKRLKVYQPQQDMPAVESRLAVEKSVLDNCDHGTDERCYFDKEILMGSTQSSDTESKKQEEKQALVSSAKLPSGVKKDTKIISNKITKVVGRPSQVPDRIAKTLPKKPHVAGLKHPSELSCHHPPTALPCNAMPSIRCSKSREVGSDNNAANHKSTDTYQACYLHDPDSNVATRDKASLNHPSFWNSSGKENHSGTSKMDLQSLLQIEELQDRELDEAQELRRMCEIEERNALKAYHMAQRALIEANARCSHLYRKRELYTAHLQSLTVENSSLLWSSMPQNLVGAGLDYVSNMSDVNMHLVPTSSHQMRAACNLTNQHGYEPNGAIQNLSGQREDGHFMACDPCSEPDASTSELQKDNDVADVGCSPSNDRDISADEHEETSHFDRKVDHSNQAYQNKEESSEMRKVDKDEAKAIDSSRDSLLLEASLRSQLFRRLQLKNIMDNRGLSRNMESMDAEEAQTDDGREKAETSMGIITFSEVEKDQCPDLGGTDEVGRSICEFPVQMNSQGPADNSNYAARSVVVSLGSSSVESISFLCPILRTAVGHMKIADRSTFVLSQNRSQPNPISENFYYKKSNGDRPDIMEPITMSSNSIKETSSDIYASEFGSYTNNIAIDPFWPLCMYELRGKCNNDECTWQHVRDYSAKGINNVKSDSAVRQIGSALHGVKFFVAPPTYPVCLDVLKAGMHSHKHVLAQSVAQCWHKYFSASLVLSSMLPTDLPSKELFMHGRETRIEVHGVWSRQSSYFCSKMGAMNQLGQHRADKDQSLEMALLNFNQEVTKQKGRMQALKVLARALEVDPTSAVTWIVYLLIYYSNQRSIGKDDMFHCAVDEGMQGAVGTGGEKQMQVEHNKGSYELWLMYINSRVQLHDRLVAYDSALSALCQHVVAPHEDAIHASECILDLFLQMLNCLCVCGMVGEAIQKVYGLFPTAKKSDEPHRLFFSDVLSCLTVSDKCIFWVSCVYLVVYRRLPNSLVQHFECQKEPSAIEWPSVHLTADEKQQAITLMETAVDSLALYIDSESLQSRTTLEAAHLFAVNHIRCIAVLEGMECSRNLLDKYIKLYPSCLELVLMSARAHELGDLSFVGFEEALCNWLHEIPGVQCIWNQYAECALQNGRSEFLRELMDRWFHTVWNVQCSQNDILDTMETGNSCRPLESDIDYWISVSPQIDAVFGLLNLSIFKLLHSDLIEARSSIDRALKVASAEDYRHCVREHAMFLLTHGLQFKEDAPLDGLLNVLSGYLFGARAFPAYERLSRKFLLHIKRQRVRQLVSNLLTPVSSDCSLVNLVLEVWHGPSLLPQVFDNLKDLVDLVEAIMEVVPANYQLAISVCKLLSRSSNSQNISANVSFWASSLLVTALFQAVPVAPEHVWLEAADVLHNLTDIQPICESFYKRALSVYPYSMKLWKSYLNLFKVAGKASEVKEAAIERGINIH
ncbi:hypothetical protein RJ639_033694 [Escallonia herrerae]|uniref:Putative zinc-finger domain-containing protein n=1 Tax=Escallonia herrerae TaxID=1293975 RepID=A0AA89BBI3_9ASTE|nr:hypothetical protein RJ639_033694 [Escallonia herrerae]